MFYKMTLTIMTLTWGFRRYIYFLFVMYFECFFETLLNSFLVNFYMICTYFIHKKRKRTLLKKINILATLPSRNHSYPIFRRVPLLKVNAYWKHSDSYTIVAGFRSYRMCGTDCSVGIRLNVKHSLFWE